MSHDSILSELRSLLHGERTKKRYEQLWDLCARADADWFEQVALPYVLGALAASAWRDEPFEIPWRHKSLLLREEHTPQLALVEMWRPTTRFTSRQIEFVLTRPELTRLRIFKPPSQVEREKGVKHDLGDVFDALLASPPPSLRAIQVLAFPNPRRFIEPLVASSLWKQLEHVGFRGVRTYDHGLEYALAGVEMPRALTLDIAVGRPHIVASLCAGLDLSKLEELDLTSFAYTSSETARPQDVVIAEALAKSGAPLRRLEMSHPEPSEVSKSILTDAFPDLEWGKRVTWRY